MLVFVEGGKPENPEKNPRSKDENQQQTQPTFDADMDNRCKSAFCSLIVSRSYFIIIQQGIGIQLLQHSGYPAILNFVLFFLLHL